MKRISLFFLFFLSVITSNAYEVDGVNYDILDEGKKTAYAEVTHKNYSGDVIIASSINVAGKNYPVTSIRYYAFRDCYDLTSVTIPNSVTNIGHGAFKGCTGLTHIEIPNSVTRIGGGYYEDGAFSGCTGLTSVTIPNSVTEIGHSTFQGCSSLTSIVIPNSVTSIGEGAFGCCYDLTSVTIPNSVTYIGMGAFDYCSSLTSIIVEEENRSYDSRNNCNAIIETATNTLIRGCKNTIIPNSVTGIRGGYRPQGYGGAFSGCSGLTSITIPNSVTYIGSYAFSNCYDLTSVTIPNSVTDIGEHAFRGCSSLPVIDNLRYADTYLVEAIDIECTSVHIKEGTRFIGDDAFNDCSSLTSITIPNSVTTIGDCAFYYCKGLTSVTIGNSVKSIGNSAFSYCTNIRNIHSNNPTPPKLGYLSPFSEVKTMHCILYVPIGAKENYAFADGWCDFYNIVEEEVNAIEPVAIPETNSNDASIHTLSGTKANTNNLPAGIYIKNGKKMLVK